MSMELTIWGCRGSYPKPYTQQDLQEKNEDLLNAIRGNDTARELFLSGASVDSVLAAVDAARTHVYGGHTSCYQLDVNGQTLIFDVGLGAVPWGDYEVARGANGKTKPLKVLFFQTHTHLDHNEAAGFIKPWFAKGHDFTIYGVANANDAVRTAQKDNQDAKSGTATIMKARGQDTLAALHETRPELAKAIEAIVREATRVGEATPRTVEDVMIAISDKGLHPIPWAARQGFGAEIKTVDLPVHSEGGLLYVGNGNGNGFNDFKVGYQMSNHPDGCLSYRVETDTGVFIYMGDGEHGPLLGKSRHPLLKQGVKPEDQPVIDPHFIKFIMGKDEAHKPKVVVMDAHWTQPEYDKMTFIHGWGHSSAEQCLFTAAMAAKHGGNTPNNRVHVELSHHDPNKSDRRLDQIASDLEKYTATRQLDGRPLNDYVTWNIAREGRKITI